MPDGAITRDHQGTTNTTRTGLYQNNKKPSRFHLSSMKSIRLLGVITIDSNLLVSVPAWWASYSKTFISYPLVDYVSNIETNVAVVSTFRPDPPEDPARYYTGSLLNKFNFVNKKTTSGWFLFKIEG